MSTVTRPSSSTTLRVGALKTPVALYKVVGESAAKKRKWDLADAEGEPWGGGSSPAAAPAETGDPLGGEVTAEKVAANEVTAAKIGGAVPPAGGASEGVVPPGASEGVVPGNDDASDRQQRIDAAAEEIAREHGLTDGDGRPDGTARRMAEERIAPAEPEKPRKGIRKADGGFVDLTDQIEEIAERSTLEEMRIISFIDSRHVPRERIVSSYYLAGAEMTPGLADSDLNVWPPGRLLRVMATAMRATKKVAVVRFSKRKGQTLGVLVPRRDGALMLLEVAFAAQVRQPNGKCLAHTKAEVSKGAIEGAAALIEAMAGKRDSLDGIRDVRVVMEDELIARAEAGELDDYELAADPEVAAETDQLGELLAAAAQAPA